MLNALSNNKNNNVNVVNAGAISTKLSGETHPVPGPMVKPKIIKNKTSGIPVLLKINSAKKPKNKIKLIDNKIITTSTRDHLCIMTKKEV